MSSGSVHKGGKVTVITVERVPKKRLEQYRTPDGTVPDGLTLSPVKAVGGFQKIEILIREKLTREQSLIVHAHEMFHALQYLTGCKMDEGRNNDIDVVMAAALISKRGKK